MVAIAGRIPKLSPLRPWIAEATSEAPALTKNIYLGLRSLYVSWLEKVFESFSNIKGRDEYAGKDPHRRGKKGQTGGKHQWIPGFC
jgi:hypothetical protein